MSVKHAEENSSVLLKKNLSKELISQLEQIYKNNNFYDPSLKQKALDDEIKKN